MRAGQKCRLDVSTWDSCPLRQSAPYATVVGVVVGERRHLDDVSRVLYYFHTLRVERSMDTVAAERSGGRTHQRREKKEELSVGTHALSSSSGFKYTFDGWYDEIFLYKIDGEEAVVTLQREWQAAMEQDTSPCELLYLCYAIRPWFQSPFVSLQYVQMPHRHLCYSISVCHRCLSPFVSQRHLQEHLEGYCRCCRPPGVLLYDDTEYGRRVFYLDGAEHMHYGRCLCLLGKAFLESKEVETDVDIYEFFVVTATRASLPYVVGEMEESTFRREAAHFDEAHWGGDAVVGYFSRIKHCPDHCLSCIVTLPVFQKQGVGFFMLDLAYSLTAMRQRLCGCEAACGTRGGAISRPFSPHGQALLLAYWRRRVTAALMRTTAQPTAREGGAAAGGVSFRALHEMVVAGGCRIHEDDLRFFALRDERCFYARVAPDVAASPSPRRATTGGGGGGGPLGFAPPPSEFVGSVLLFSRDAPQEERRAGAFDRRFLCRDTSGRHVYNSELFHY